MNFNGWNNFEDLFKACGCNNSSENENNSSNSENNSSDNKSNYGCNDIPNGFQTLNPELFVIISEIIGNIIAGNTPSNVQNIIGNWFELVGQVILTFNAQQQYFESGPGRFFNPKNFNIDNPFCNTNSKDTNSSTSNSSTSSKSSNSKTTNSDTSRIEELEKQVQELTNEINKLKNIIQK